MIKAHQMQDRVRQQQIQYRGKTTLMFCGHDFRRLRRDHHIPQQFRAYFAEFPVVHGKSQHIGRSLNLAIIPVQASDLVIIDNRDTQLRLSVTQGA